MHLPTEYFCNSFKAVLIINFAVFRYSNYIRSKVCSCVNRVATNYWLHKNACSLDRLFNMIVHSTERMVYSISSPSCSVLFQTFAISIEINYEIFLCVWLEVISLGTEPRESDYDATVCEHI